MPKSATHVFHYPAEKARQGEIVLRRPWQRNIFIGGLVGCALLLILATLFSGSLH